MKNKLLSLLPVFFALTYASGAFAVPTTSMAVGNSMLYISGPTLANSAIPSVLGNDGAGHPLTDIAMPPVTKWEPETINAAVTDVKFDPPPMTILAAASAAIPEPSILLLAGLGLAALGLRRRRS